MEICKQKSEIEMRHLPIMKIEVLGWAWHIRVTNLRCGQGYEL